jgi:hypothetical protein
MPVVRPVTDVDFSSMDGESSGHETYYGGEELKRARSHERHISLCKGGTLTAGDRLQPGTVFMSTISSRIALSTCTTEPLIMTVVA